MLDLMVSGISASFQPISVNIEVHDSELGVDGHNESISGKLNNEVHFVFR